MRNMSKKVASALTFAALTLGGATAPAAADDGAGRPHEMGPGEADAGVGPALPPTAPRTTSGCGCATSAARHAPLALASALGLVAVAVTRRRQRGASQSTKASSR